MAGPNTPSLVELLYENGPPASLASYPSESFGVFAGLFRARLDYNTMAGIGKHFPSFTARLRNITRCIRTVVVKQKIVVVVADDDDDDDDGDGERRLVCAPEWKRSEAYVQKMRMRCDAMDALCDAVDSLQSVYRHLQYTYSSLAEQLCNGSSSTDMRTVHEFSTWIDSMESCTKGLMLAVNIIDATCGESGGVANKRRRRRQSVFDNVEEEEEEEQVATPQPVDARVNV
jgi:hypothetical protein